MLFQFKQALHFAISGAQSQTSAPNGFPLNTEVSGGSRNKQYHAGTFMGMKGHARKYRGIQRNSGEYII